MAAYIDGEETFADDENGRNLPLVGMGGMCIAFEKCPLCHTTRRPFSCERCVERGNFIHSASKNGESERYCEKLDRLQRLRNERERLFTKLARKLKENATVVDKQWEVSLMKGRLQWRRQAIDEVKIEEEKAKEARLQNTERVKAAKAKREEQTKKLAKIEKYIEHVRTNIENRQEGLREKVEQLRSKRQERIEQLTHHIFPISEIQHVETQEEGWHEEERMMETEDLEGHSEEEELVAALADARRTSYVRGRWVETINNGEAHYSIVHPSVRLPANGDYSAYIACSLASESDIPDPDAELDLHNPGHQVAAALGYTAQFVLHLANILDVPLARRAHFSRFCNSEMNLKEFSLAVAKLNCSILFLCFSQKISPDFLHPHYTLRNLRSLFECSHQDYGRTQDFEVHSDLLLATLTSPNMTSMENGSGSESQHDSQDEDDGSSTGSADHEEWETVTTSTSIPSLPLPIPQGADERKEGEMPLTPFPPEPIPSASVMSASNLPHTTGGLMSSAAASVASLWRAATSQLEKR